jgi:ABC-type transport system involved in multi-copper enzyme maturation permease subunit
MKGLFLLMEKEIGDLFFSKTSLLIFLIICFIFGYSFYTALTLYSTASASALNNPLYAAGFEPVPGVFVPTYGGLFLIFSLFLPFVFIPLISVEKRQNTLNILLQLPFTLGGILISKIIAAVLLLLFILFLSIPAVILWSAWGGHLPYRELILLTGGYFLYGILIIGVSLFSASVFSSTASASIFAIVLIIISWLIDFGKEMNISPLLLLMSGWTLTDAVKFFEDGIFSLRVVLYFLLLSATLFTVSYVLLKPDLKTRWRQLFIVAGIGLILIKLSSSVAVDKDITESFRNSFPPHMTAAIKKVPPLEIEVYMERTDSRFKDYEKSLLKRLLLIKHDVRVVMMKGEQLKESYGLYVYKVGEKSEKTYSNSEEEIFPILFDLAGIKPDKPDDEKDYPGYPLVATGRQESLVISVYFFLVPFLMVFALITRYFINKRRYLE